MPRLASVSGVMLPLHERISHGLSAGPRLVGPVSGPASSTAGGGGMSSNFGGGGCVGALVVTAVGVGAGASGFDVIRQTIRPPIPRRSTTATAMYFPFPPPVGGGGVDILMSRQALRSPGSIQTFRKMRGPYRRTRASRRSREFPAIRG